jgi:hypothetical protein
MSEIKNAINELKSAVESFNIRFVSRRKDI